MGVNPFNDPRAKVGGHMRPARWDDPATATEQGTIDRLVGLLDTHTPFVHVRFGDGDVFFATGTGPKLTADGEEWSPLLQARLQAAWRRCAVAPHLLLGDVDTYQVDDGCSVQWAAMLAELERLRGVAPELVHIEALRAGRGHALPFYLSAAGLMRPKVFVGPERLAGAARMLDADHLVVPLHVAHQHAEAEAAAIASSRWEVAFFAAGRGGKIMQGLLTETAPALTQVDVGSGLDLLFDGVRRSTDRGVDIEALRAAYRRAGLKVDT